MKKNKLLLILLLASVWTAKIYSQPKDDFKPSYNIGGLIFTGWQFNIDNAEFISKLDTVVSNNNPYGYQPVKNQFEVSKNTFYLERAYINVRAALTPQINARLTPDIYSYTDGAGVTQFSYRVKFAYFDYTPLVCENGSSLTFTLGVNQNQWTSNMDKCFGYRFVAKSLTDYPWVTSASKTGNTVIKTTSTYFSTADLGFTAKFAFPNKFGELYAAIVNGNGFRDLSFDNRFKDVQITGLVYPLAGMLNKKTEQMKKAGKDRLEGISELTFGGFAYLGKLDKGENYNGAQYKRNRFGGMLNFKFNFKNTGFIKVGGEYSIQRNGGPAVSNPDSTAEINAGGLSAYLELCPPVKSLNEKFSLLFRYDLFDPNTADNVSAPSTAFNNNNDKQNLIILGLFYKPAKVLGFGFSYQITKFQDNFVVKYDGTVTDKLERLYFNTVLEF